MAEFRILGPLEVLDEDERIAVVGHKVRSLLGLLVLHANEVVSVDRLLDALWGEEPPATARASLQNLVAQLRRLLGADAVETQAPGYRLAVSADAVDARRFERLVAGARGGEPRTRAAALHEALDLWRGPALADFVYEPWAQNEAMRLEELRLAALEQRIDADLELARHADVVGQLEALVAVHPLRERFRAQQMLALYRSGRQAEALQAYQAARRALVDELGIEPSRELQDLHASILRQESRLGLPGRAAPEEPDHLDELVRALLAGRLVPVVGTVSAGRDAAEAPPTSPALAERLATAFGYREAVVELPRVSQYVATLTGSGALYDELHDIFAAPYQPAPVHRFLAELPPMLRDRGVPHQLVVTTAYDAALERAFLDAGEEFDVVAYLASGRNRGRFCHVTPDGDARAIVEPNTYATELSLERRTVILRLHGRADTGDEREWESFVVTEDDYIAYLARAEIANVVPVSLVARLRRSHFLFVGYALRDWNLRVLLSRLWGEDKIGYRSWAVQAEAPPLERAFWRGRDVEVIETELDAYVEALARRLRAAAETPT